MVTLSAAYSASSYGRIEKMVVTSWYERSNVLWVTLQRFIMCTKSSYTNSIGGSLFSSFAYSKRTGTGILGSYFQTSIVHFQTWNLITAKRSLKIGVNSSSSKKSILVYVHKRVNRQGLGILKWFFLHFRLSETNLLPVNQQVRRLFHVHFHCTS